MKGKKGFQQGNKEQLKKTNKVTEIQNYLAYLASGAARHYYTKLESQFKGKELTDPEREAMNRFERNTEFITPKLARTETKVEVTDKRVILD